MERYHFDYKGHHFVCDEMKWAKEDETKKFAVFIGQKHLFYILVTAGSSPELREIELQETITNYLEEELGYSK